MKRNVSNFNIQYWGPGLKHATNNIAHIYLKDIANISN